MMVDDTQATAASQGLPYKTLHGSCVLWIWATFKLHPLIHITSYSTNIDYMVDALLGTRNTAVNHAIEIFVLMEFMGGEVCKCIHK